MNELLKQIRNTVRQHELIEAGDSVVVGFSGGPDSLCLLYALWLLREELGIRTLAAVHVNHLYRGETAFSDEAFCEAFCRERDIRFRAVRADVEVLAREWKVGSEEAGRKVRYEEFDRMAAELGEPVKIAVAHNREDQGETLFLRIVRGTGTAGLCGIDYKRQDGVVRPLLDCSRKEIEAFLEEEGLQPCIDPTNLEPVYTRNVVRLEVIPFINEKMGGDLNGSLANLSRIAREDRDFIDGFVEEILQHVEVEPAGRVILPRKTLASAHPAVMKRAIVRCFERAGLPQDITSVHLDQAEALLTSGNTTGEARFPRGFVMKCRYEKVYFEKDDPSSRALRMTNSAVTGRTDGIPGFTMEIIEKGAAPSPWLSSGGELSVVRTERGTDNTAFLDLEKVRAAGGEERLIMRTRQPGDVISPKGFHGTKKLKNYFIDRKIDRDLRDRLPLLCLGSQVLWIPGMEINEKFRAGDGTERVLEVKLETVSQKEPSPVTLSDS